MTDGQKRLLLAADPIDLAISDAAARLSGGLSVRLEQLAKREADVRLTAGWETLPNMPARLVWEAFEPGAAAFFVVYKLMHEARSSLPKIYRAIAWHLCSVQPDRFGIVTYREQLWSLLASIDGWPEDLATVALGNLEQFVFDALKERSESDWFCYKEDDYKRDARWIASRLRENASWVQGLRTLRRVQISQQTSITAGNVILQIPQELQTLADSICNQATEGQLRSLAEIQTQIAALAWHFAEKRNWGPCVEESVPLDLLVLQPDGKLLVVAMTRHETNREKQKELRKRMVYLRFFAHYAFGEREPKDVTTVVGFYADKKARHKQWSLKSKPLSHEEEIWSFHQFWKYIVGKDNAAQLVEKITSDAAGILRKKDLVSQVRTFVAGPKKKS